MAGGKKHGRYQVYKTISYDLMSESGSIPVTINWKKGLKYARLKITAEGLTISAPRGYSHRDINQLLRDKESWIKRHWNAIQRSMREAEAEQQDVIMFQGRPYHLIIMVFDLILVPNQRLLMLEEKLILNLVKGEEDNWQGILEEQLRHLAGHIIKTRVDKIIQMMQLPYNYNRINIRAQKTMWGSCSPQSNLSFNWRLILMPPPVLEYVIVHELCHLLEPNHSHAFWERVGKYLPNYKSHKNWLRDNGTRINEMLNKVNPKMILVQAGNPFDQPGDKHHSL